MTGRYSLKRKNTVVTGAGAGIGRAIALAFANAGAQVACVDLDLNAAESTAVEAGKSGQRCIAVACDVGIESDVASAAATILAEFPAVHVLLNGAAGYDPNGTVLDLSWADWNRVIAVNVGGAFLMSRAVLPSMIAAGGGSIIHIASQLGSVAAPRRAVYCTSKGALLQLAKAMATDQPHRTFASTRCRPARSKPSDWWRVSAAWKTRDASPGRSICSAASVSLTRSPPPRCFSPAMRRAS